jgi:ABC-type nickel/cobalt efflux system permease component RcnA
MMRFLHHLVALSRCHLVVLALLAVPSPVSAHPVPRDSHDRVITIRLTRDALIVEYLLEIDSFRMRKDLEAVLEDKPGAWAALTSGAKVYDAFSREYGPILAGNLTVTLDGKELSFGPTECGKVKETDSIQFPFVLRKAWKLEPGRRHRLTFREGNYDFETDKGQINVSIVSDGTVVILEKTQADEATKARPYGQRRSGDDRKLREASATFEIGTGPASTAEISAQSPSDTDEPSRPHTLLQLLFHSELGFWAMMALAAGLGAVHALTPGHGKTLVAAYLVGERGTAWHAVLLGVVTTLSHTGAVLLLALGLVLFFPDMVPEDVQMALGFIAGLLVAGLGFWLLVRRLSGGPDHIHIGGGHHHHHDGHHHHHEHADHYHDEHGHVHALPKEPVGWRGLVLLGISGGIVPCWDAIAMFGLAIKAQQLWLALPLLVAFSAGLAGVLVAIGIAVVYAKGFAGSRWGESRLFKALPIISAAIVFVLGLWLCYDSLHSGTG